MNHDDIRAQVREGYGAVARGGSSCCGVSPGGDLDDYAKGLGYSEEELAAIPEEANLGLGCGNPSAIAALSPGEVVVDLGSGAGMDVFLAAERVGESGRVIGIDMTPDMLKRARDTASKRGVAHYVEFREGLIEALPVVNDSVDVIISNCVINLSPDKPQAFREAFRVLKPGGRIAVSDVCLSEAIPGDLRNHSAAYLACLGGAIVEDAYFQAIRDAGFTDVSFVKRSAAGLVDAACQDPMLKEELSALEEESKELLRKVAFSYQIQARKPGGDSMAKAQSSEAEDCCAPACCS